MKRNVNYLDSYLSIGDFHPAWMDELEPKEESKIRIMTVKDFSPKAVKVLFPN